MTTLWKCVAEPSGNPPGPPHAARMPHMRTLRMPAKTQIAGDKIDAPAACEVPFRPYCGGFDACTCSMIIFYSPVSE